MPFLDKKSLRLPRALPRKLRVNSENTKYAMRKGRDEAPARRQPRRKKKLGFPVPIRVGWAR